MEKNFLEWINMDNRNAETKKELITERLSGEIKTIHRSKTSHLIIPKIIEKKYSYKEEEFVESERKEYPVGTAEYYKLDKKLLEEGE